MRGEPLLALLDRRVVGTIESDRGRLRLIYDEEWRAGPESFPLSVSLPLAIPTHDHATVDAFLWGLLPDNAAVIEQWARRFGVSARNAFAILSHVGEDCAGAAQYVSAERAEQVLAESDPEVDWIEPQEIADRLRTLRSDHSAGRKRSDRGQFSLAGAQPKTAFLRVGQRWGIPSGRVPTTHIFKPPTGAFQGLVENEQLCMALGRAVGLAVARSRVVRFLDEIAIVVERYDRRFAGPVQPGDLDAEAAVTLVRIHQEDTCQALGYPPGRKYQSDGGPSPAEIVTLLRNYSDRPTEDVITFVDALIFNWLILGTDAHSKNYSLLHGKRSRLRLAPLYDLASFVPYDDDPQRTKLAMKIGGQYRIREIGRRQWEKTASELRVPPETVIARARDLAGRIIDRVSEVREAHAELDHPVLDTLVDALSRRATECRRSLR